jgi:hypothetical protein
MTLRFGQASYDLTRVRKPDEHLGIVRQLPGGEASVVAGIQVQQDIRTQVEALPQTGTVYAYERAYIPNNSRFEPSDYAVDFSVQLPNQPEVQLPRLTISGQTPQAIAKQGQLITTQIQALLPPQA